MRSLTLNDVFQEILDERLIRNEKGSLRFDRKEKIAAVFPEAVLNCLTSKSASYLSWFLSDDKRGDSVRRYVQGLFVEDPLTFLQAMVTKCRQFLGRADGGQRIPDAVWNRLLERLGKDNSLFVRGSRGAEELQKMLQPAPHRVLALLLLQAGTMGLTARLFEDAMSCWRFLDHDEAEISTGSSKACARFADLLYIDGDRKAALLQYKKAADLLEKEGTPQSGEKKQFAAELLLKTGKMLQEGDGCDADPFQAVQYFEKSASLGSAEAEYLLGTTALQNNYAEKARAHFLKGAFGGNPDCLRLLGNDSYYGEPLNGGKTDLTAAAFFYLKGARPENTRTGDPYCQYMLGRILEERPDKREEERKDKRETERKDRRQDKRQTSSLPQASPDTDPEAVGAGAPDQPQEPFYDRDYIREHLTGKAAGPDYWYEASARGGNRRAASALNRRRWYAFGETPRDSVPADFFGTAPSSKGTEPEKVKALSDTAPEKEPADADRIPEQGQAVIRTPMGKNSFCQSLPETLSDLFPASPAHGSAGKKRPKLCILNSFSGKNRIFAESLPAGEYVLFVPQRPVRDDLSSWDIPLSFHEKRSGRVKRSLLNGNILCFCCESMPLILERILDYFLADLSGRFEPGKQTTLPRGREVWKTGRDKAEKTPASAGRMTPDPSLSAVEVWAESFPEILLIALGEEEKANISDGLHVLRTAFLMHEKLGQFAGQPARFSEKSVPPAPGRNTPREEAAQGAVAEAAQGTAAGAAQGASAGAAQGAAALFYLLSDRLHLYVLGKGEVCGPVFDSACSRLGDFYIPLHLCDPQKLTSLTLLDQMPLFLPCLPGLQKGRQARMDILIAGDHPGIVQVCKDALAAAQIDDIPFSLTVVSEIADDLEKLFRTQCPGFFQPPSGVNVSAPHFIKMSPESAEFQQLLTIHSRSGQTSAMHSRSGQTSDRTSRQASPQSAGQDAPDREKAALVQSASYIIVYTADEDRNLTLSMYLREWYLRTDPSYTRLPFIAAYCKNSDLAGQMQTLTVGTEEFGFSWYNNYNIESFGQEKLLFSYSELVRSRLERRSLASHCSYYTDRQAGHSWSDSFSSEALRHQALQDYYSRAYNRDSSAVNALALPYRLFSAGIAFPDWHSYAAGISQKALAERFSQWILGDGDPALGGSRRNILAMQEHGRWTRSMLSFGWLGATPEQMQSYIHRGSDKHQLYLAKLHPFICSWDNLGENEPEPTGLQKTYNTLMRQVRPGARPSGIRDIDRKYVEKTAQLMVEKP